MDEEKGLLDKSDDELFRELSDGISDYLHGPAREHVAQTLSQAGDELDDTIAAVGYQTLSEVSKQIEQISPELVSLEMLLPLATETIDYLIEIADAVGAPVGDVNGLRERSLMKMIEIHMATLEDDPEQKAMAQEMFAQFLQDGTFDQASEYIAKKIREEGGDPEQIKQQAMQPRRDPLAAGVQQGLAGQQGGLL